ncbi:uncharacterized protein Dwil_GK26806 [Drosophila willistoni]|uniref:Uncharacterized protein n=1 Tax=Drosophila willistoni TaxID=7260 RepID=A0A0Q9X3D4_DROWI|nr:uncharacterized protein Dwil_GK26806 [Drosophila willistoni]
MKSFIEEKTNQKLKLDAIQVKNINHDVPMQQLIRGPGNYDFCNWLYHFYVANDTGRSYDAKEMRHNAPIGLNRNGFRFVINLKRSQSIFVVKEEKSTKILRRNGSVLHAALKANCKMAHPEVYYCYESRYVPLPPDSEVDTESANSESREFDNEIIHEAKPGVIHMDSSSKNLVHEYANNKDKPETLQKDTSCENLVHETEKEECKRTAKIGPILGRRDIFRKQEMEILNLRKQQRECAATLDSIKAVLLEDSYDSDRCLKNIRKIVFNNSETELYDNPE